MEIGNKVGCENVAKNASVICYQNWKRLLIFCRKSACTVLLVSNAELIFQTPENPEWWRSSVIYQIYPRSFADGNGDGMGDLKGVTERLDSLVELGVDAIWFSPFMLSPQKDAGYDITDYKQIDPLFGNLDDFDKLVAAATAKGLRIIVDMVPNHSSDQNELFQKALKAAPGSAERDMYIFRDGKGLFKRKEPNNWPSVFGGASWTRIREANGKKGQWYLHIFDSSQPDFNWRNPKVVAYFEDILRFWLDRGVAGFRIDVAHGLIKRDGLPDTEDFSTEMGGSRPDDELTIQQLERKNPYWGQPEVHPIIRRWRKVLDEYDDRLMAAEAWLGPLDRMANWVRPDEYHQSFNFDLLEAEWDVRQFAEIIVTSHANAAAVGATSTWVLSNHDVPRHRTRYGTEAQKQEWLPMLTSGQALGAFGLTEAKIVLVWQAAVFPILISTTSGIANANRDLTEMAQSFGASRRVLFWQVMVPDALPAILSGLRIGAAISTVGTVIAELTMAQSGLGGLMITAGNRFQMDRYFAVVIVLMALGTLITGGLRLAERRFARWRVVMTEAR